jgi:hypothetical protein
LLKVDWICTTPFGIFFFSFLFARVFFAIYNIPISCDTAINITLQDS